MSLVEIALWLKQVSDAPAFVRSFINRHSQIEDYVIKSNRVIVQRMKVALLQTDGSSGVTNEPGLALPQAKRTS